MAVLSVPLRTDRRQGGCDWRNRFAAAKAPHVVMLPSDFADVKAGSRMLISSPAEIATYLARVPRGETRTMDRFRTEMARKAGAQAMCR